MLKRAFDFVVALVGLVLLSPVLIAIAIAIKIDSGGPVLYRALRAGKGGRPFYMYKFRTMAAREGPRVTARDDPRITRLGRFLRNSKLNELPQLFNVLKGEMSLVGPRPEDPEFVAHYSPEERLVLSVRPGITSPASILYRHEEAMLAYEDAAQTYLRDILPSKLRLDLLYIRRRSFLLDLDVLMQTLIALLPLVRREATVEARIFAGPIQRLVRHQLLQFLLDWAAAFAAVALAGLLWRAWRPLNLGWGRALLMALSVALAFSLISQVLRRLWSRSRRLLGAPHDLRERVLVVGGGDAGRMTVGMLQNGIGLHAFHVVGVIDDDLWKQGAGIRGVRVLGDRSRIPQVVKEQCIDLIVFAIHNIDPATREAILAICRATPARVAVMPDIAALLAPEARSGQTGAAVSGGGPARREGDTQR